MVDQTSASWNRCRRFLADLAAICRAASWLRADEGIAWQIDVDALEVVLPRATNLNARLAPIGTFGCRGQVSADIGHGVWHVGHEATGP